MRSGVISVAVGTAAGLAVVAMRLLSSHGPGDEPPAPRRPLDVYLGLRRQALATSPASLGLAAPSYGGEPWGILMETGFDEAVVTLVSMATGDASLYFSTGGGVIGGGGHENVREAAKRFVSSAQDYWGRMELVASHPLPALGEVRFYVLTAGGVFSSVVDEEALVEGRSALSPLFYAGQAVITELRLLTERVPG